MKENTVERANAQRNPYADPTAGLSGSTAEILESLTNAELETYINHLLWEQEHRTFSESNVYTSRGYHAYRSGNWIGQCREILQRRRHEPWRDRGNV